jgi:hypothetical protein
MTYDLRNFGLAAMLKCGPALRRVVLGTPTLEAAADAIVRHLYDNCVSPETGERSCVLVRFYKTHPYGALEPGLQVFARRGSDGREITPATRCLTLLATAGQQDAWNSRHQSRGHKVIPLASQEAVQRAPMIAQLIQQFGLEVAAVVEPSRDLVADLGNRSYNVFHVEQAKGSRYIPAQDDFVIPYDVESVVGIGATLRTGDLFAVIMFSRVTIAKESANRLRNVALDVKAAIFHFEEAQVFATATPGAAEARP